jgi:exopolysaccharide production protein ExoZ
MQQLTNKFNTDLEGLRGFAAIGVMLAHGLGLDILDVEYKGQGIIPYFSFGGLAVLLFFVLSGYVITSSTNFVSTFNIRKFYLKRSIRLYPIYLFSFALIAIFLGFSYKPIVTVFNILFLQNDHSYFGISFPVDRSNSPSWSLN